MRYGPDRLQRVWHDRGKPQWVQSAADAEYFREHPAPDTYERVPSSLAV